VREGKTQITNALQYALRLLSVCLFTILFIFPIKAEEPGKQLGVVDDEMRRADSVEHMDGEGEAAAAAAEGGQPAVAPPRQPLSRAALRRVAAVIVQLAGRAQYSKVRSRWGCVLVCALAAASSDFRCPNQASWLRYATDAALSA